MTVGRETSMQTNKQAKQLTRLFVQAQISRAVK